MDIMLISISAFVGVACLVAAALSSMDAFKPKTAEERLMALAGLKMPTEMEARGIMKSDLVKISRESLWAGMNERFQALGRLFEQADSPIDFSAFLMISAASGAVLGAACWVANGPLPLVPFCVLMGSTFPFIWLLWRRSARFAKFAKQFPDAMELIARALRSGHSLNSGLNVVVTEMPAPISNEFAMAYEEQNLGISIEQALKNMLKRMPNMDLKFFVTAVAIQRTTGGDLAEILDKIGHVIRERFKILGMVQALTAEGRLSGAVLMALPIAIFVAVYFLNPDYVMLLFTTEIGKKMIAAGAFMQVLGAICIKKIIDIKV